MEHKRQKENKSGRLNIGVNAIMNKSINNNGNPSHPNIGVNADTQPLPLSASGWHLKVFIRTFGCQMNTRDSEAVLGLFLERGYSVSLTAEGADVVLINTCSVREHAESRALSFAGTFKKLSAPLAKPVIGLIGCMAINKGAEIFKKMRHIDLICGPSTLNKIPEYVEKIIDERQSNKEEKQNLRIIDIIDTERNELLYQAEFRDEPDHAQVVISTGCSNFCSYCVVPYVRGNIRLRNPKDIVKEVEKNVALGIKKITLLGQNVNDYRYVEADIRGMKRGKTRSFVDLLKEIDEVQGVEEINFITSQPKNTSKELFTLMAKSSKISKNLHLPFQSGSNRILKLMNRGYTREKYLELVSDYKNIVGGMLSTDVIIGFPTETEEDFEQTKDIIEQVRFRCSYIFKYSPRLKAKSANIKDDVPSEDKSRRHKILLDLQKKISKDLNKE